MISPIQNCDQAPFCRQSTPVFGRQSKPCFRRRSNTPSIGSTSSASAVGMAGLPSVALSGVVEPIPVVSPDPLLYISKARINLLKIIYELAIKFVTW